MKIKDFYKLINEGKTFDDFRYSIRDKTKEMKDNNYTSEEINTYEMTEYNNYLESIEDPTQKDNRQIEDVAFDAYKRTGGMQAKTKVYYFIRKNTVNNKYYLNFFLNDIIKPNWEAETIRIYNNFLNKVIKSRFKKDDKYYTTYNIELLNNTLYFKIVKDLEQANKIIDAVFEKAKNRISNVSNIEIWKDVYWKKSFDIDFEYLFKIN